MDNNPRNMSIEDIEQIYQIAFNFPIMNDYWSIVANHRRTDVRSRRPGSFNPCPGHHSLLIVPTIPMSTHCYPELFGV